MNQSLLDRIRIFNKNVTNKLTIHLAGKKLGHFVILSHFGRRSGKLYRVPIIAEPFQNGFVIALTYGRKVDWYANVAARGSCLLRWKNRDYRLIHPEFIDKEVALMAFPVLLRSALKFMKIQDFLQLEIQE